MLGEVLSALGQRSIADVAQWARMENPPTEHPDDWIYLDYNNYLTAVRWAMANVPSARHPFGGTKPIVSKTLA